MFLQLFEYFRELLYVYNLKCCIIVVMQLKDLQQESYSINLESLEFSFLCTIFKKLCIVQVEKKILYTHTQFAIFHTMHIL